MDAQRSQELIVGCLAASTVVAAGSALAQGTAPGLRLLVGLGFTGVGLATVSMFAPDLAGSFAVLILTSTVFVYGGPAFNAVTSLTGGTPVTPSPKAKAKPQSKATTPPAEKSTPA